MTLTVCQIQYLSFLAQTIFQENVVQRRQSEFDRLREERDRQIQQMLQARRQERDAIRKKIFYVRTEEEKQRKLQEEEEARKREGRILYKIIYMLMKTFCEEFKTSHGSDFTSERSLSSYFLLIQLLHSLIIFRECFPLKNPEILQSK